MRNKIFSFFLCYFMFFLCFSSCATIFYLIGCVLNYLSDNKISPPEVKYYIGSAIMSFFIAIYYLWEVDKRNR